MRAYLTAASVLPLVEPSSDEMPALTYLHRIHSPRADRQTSADTHNHTPHKHRSPETSARRLHGERKCSRARESVQPARAAVVGAFYRPARTAEEPAIARRTAAASRRREAPGDQLRDERKRATKAALAVSGARARSWRLAGGNLAGGDTGKRALRPRPRVRGGLARHKNIGDGYFLT